jgi:hypothetical protein
MVGGAAGAATAIAMRTTTTSDVGGPPRLIGAQRARGRRARTEARAVA